MNNFLEFQSTQKDQRQKRIAMSVRAAVTTCLPQLTQWVPSLHRVRITVLDVMMTPDLRKALVVVHPPIGATSSQDAFPSLQEQEMLKALQELAPQVRKHLASHLRLRFAPEVRFRIDTKISALYTMADLLQRSSQPS